MSNEEKYAMLVCLECNGVKGKDRYNIHGFQQAVLDLSKSNARLEHTRHVKLLCSPGLPQLWKCTRCASERVYD